MRALCKTEEDVESEQVHNFLSRKLTCSKDVLIDPKFTLEPGCKIIPPRSIHLHSVDTFDRDVVGLPSEMRNVDEQR